MQENIFVQKVERALGPNARDIFNLRKSLALPQDVDCDALCF